MLATPKQLFQLSFINCLLTDCQGSWTQILSILQAQSLTDQQHDLLLDPFLSSRPDPPRRRAWVGTSLSSSDHQLGNELFHLMLLSNAEFVPDTPKRSSGKWHRRIHPPFVPNFVHNWATAFTIYPIISRVISWSVRVPPPLLSCPLSA